MSVVICRRVEGVGVVFSPLHICYVDDYSRASDANFRDFREANVSLKSVDSIRVLWRPRGDLRSRTLLNIVVLMAFHYNTT
jgi:hypothetical protein